MIQKDIAPIHLFDWATFSLSLINVLFFECQLTGSSRGTTKQGVWLWRSPSYDSQSCGSTSPLNSATTSLKRKQQRMPGGRSEEFLLSISVFSVGTMWPSGGQEGQQGQRTSEYLYSTHCLNTLYQSHMFRSFSFNQCLAERSVGN